MGKRGPRPEPTELKVAKGNPGLRRLNVLEPAPQAQLPRMPGWLSKKGKTAWRRLAPQLLKVGLLTELDADALAIMCQVWSEWRDALGLCRKLSRTAATPNGYRQVSAYHVLEQSLRRDFLRVAAEFGMTPSGRSGLSVNMDQRENALQLWVLRKQEIERRRAEKKGLPNV